MYTTYCVCSVIDLKPRGRSATSRSASHRVKRCLRTSHCLRLFSLFVVCWGVCQLFVGGIYPLFVILLVTCRSVPRLCPLACICLCSAALQLKGGQLTIPDPYAVPPFSLSEFTLNFSRSTLVRDVQVSAEFSCQQFFALLWIPPSHSVHEPVYIVSPVLVAHAVLSH